VLTRLVLDGIARHESLVLEHVGHGSGRGMERNGSDLDVVLVKDIETSDLAFGHDRVQIAGNRVLATQGALAVMARLGDRVQALFAHVMPAHEENHTCVAGTLHAHWALDVGVLGGGLDDGLVVAKADRHIVRGAWHRHCEGRARRGMQCLGSTSRSDWHGHCRGHEVGCARSQHVGKLIERLVGESKRNKPVDGGRRDAKHAAHGLAAPAGTC
jgi:hypothetical protein